MNFIKIENFYINLDNVQTVKVIEPSKIRLDLNNENPMSEIILQGDYADVVLNHIKKNAEDLDLEIKKINDAKTEKLEEAVDKNNTGTSMDTADTNFEGGTITNEGSQD